MLRNHIIVCTLALSLLPCLASTQQPTEPELHIAKFSAGDLTGWKDQVIFGTKNSSTYSFVKENGRSVLMGKSSDGASGLIRKIEIDPKKYQVIQWSWRIEHTVKKGNERTKGGHDFAARLYVVFPRGFFSSHRALEYVWGNVMHKGEFLASPYSKNAVMIAVDTGNELAGQWTSHKRNFVEDYRTAFGEEPPKVGAIAIMSDSDNTHESSVGYFGDITVVAPREELQKKEKEQPPKEQPKEQLHKEPTKEPLHKELIKEQPLKEQQKGEPKPKGGSPKEQPAGTALPPPAPVAPSVPAPSR